MLFGGGGGSTCSIVLGGNMVQCDKILTWRVYEVGNDGGSGSLIGVRSVDGEKVRAKVWKELAQILAVDLAKLPSTFRFFLVARDGDPITVNAFKDAPGLRYDSMHYIGLVSTPAVILENGRLQTFFD